MTRPRDIADGINRIDTSAADATAITIDSSENVGIGTSSPSSFGGNLVASGTGSIINARSSSGTSAIGLWEGSSSRFFLVSLNGSDGLSFVDGDGSSERMRIASDGIGIGTTNTAPSSGISGVVNFNGSGTGFELHLTDSGSGSTASDGCLFSWNNPNQYVYNREAGPIIFGTDNTERMRINPTGNALSIGKTTFGTAGTGFTVYGNTGPQCYFNKSISGPVNGVLFYHSDTYVGGLNYDNTSTSIATSSDERLKDNIENSDDAGAKIDAMQVRQFDWKSTGEHQEYGFVAQELEPVFAHAVHTDKEGDYKSVDYACLVPMLVKEIQSLRQRITDLENA